MDNGIALIAVVVAAVVGSAVMWLALEGRNLTPDQATALAAYVAAIRVQLAGIVDEPMIRSIAGAVWDTWAGTSKYFTRDQFIEYVLKALRAEGPAAEQVYRANVEGFTAVAHNLKII
jgi:hypothetical protein